MQNLPEKCRPLTTEQGCEEQAQLPFVSDPSVVGWQIATTRANGQSHIHVRGPLAGCLLSGQVFGSGATVPSAGKLMRVAPEGTRANVLGDPCIALTWLSKQRSALGIILQKGQVVRPGTRMVPLVPEPGDTATEDYCLLGHVRTTFSWDQQVPVQA